jgi:hypothetical protein
LAVRPYAAATPGASAQPLRAALPSRLLAPPLSLRRSILAPPLATLSPPSAARHLSPPFAPATQTQVTDLIFWLLIFLYTSICQKSAATLICLPYKDRSLLAADVSIVCYESTTHMVATALSVFAIVFLCIGIPIGFAFAVHRWHKGTPRQQQRIELLTSCYKPETWYYESVDLLRKWLMNSAVLLVWPNSEWQLIFGA